MGVARQRGRAAEDLARAYLELSGSAVCERNVRLGGVEVDLVAEDGSTQVVVEVKYRQSSEYGGAPLAVDGSQRAPPLRAARALAPPGPVRIDVLGIEPTPHGGAVPHYRNALTQGAPEPGARTPH